MDLAHGSSEFSISDFGILTSKREHHHDSLTSCHNVQDHRRPPPLNRQSGCGQSDIVEGRTVCRWTTLSSGGPTYLPACLSMIHLLAITSQSNTKIPQQTVWVWQKRSNQAFPSNIQRRPFSFARYCSRQPRPPAQPTLLFSVCHPPGYRSNFGWTYFGWNIIQF